MKKIICLLLMITLLITSVCVFAGEPSPTYGIRPWAYQFMSMSDDLTSYNLGNTGGADIYAVPYTANNGSLMLPLYLVNSITPISLCGDAIYLNDVKATVGMCEIYKSGTMHWSSDAPTIINGTIFIPLFVLELSGYNVLKDGEIYWVSQDLLEYDKLHVWCDHAMRTLVSPPSKEKLYKDSCKDVPFKVLDKDADSMKWSPVKYSGRVVEVWVQEEFTFMRIATKGKYDNIILAAYVGNVSKYEGDRVTIYGDVFGKYKYISDYGIYCSVPLIKAYYID